MNARIGVGWLTVARLCSCVRGEELADDGKPAPISGCPSTTRTQVGSTVVGLDKLRRPGRAGQEDEGRAALVHGVVLRRPAKRRCRTFSRCTRSTRDKGLRW